MSTEQWRDVVGYEGQYEVSSYGRVRSIPRTVRQGSRWGTMRDVNYPGVDLSPSPSSGYPSVSLSKRDVKTTTGIHRLVLEAFIGQPPEGCVGCHNDGDKTNNRLSNLRWDTTTGNHADKKKHGTQPMGSKIYNANLNEWSVEIIKTILRDSTHLNRVARLADVFGVSVWVIYDISSGKTWKHVRIT